PLSGIGTTPGGGSRSARAPIASTTSATTDERSRPEYPMSSGAPAARGRHAPPPEVRLPLQRRRLLQAAAEEFASRGYAQASSESISKRAGMSKATFYEHFANKEDCMVALFDVAAESLLHAM